MLTNADMTLYRKNDAGYERRYIAHVMWQDSKRSNMLKTGNSGSDTVFIIIPEKEALGLCMKPQDDIFVKGECTLEFDNSTPASISESKKMLKQDQKVYTVTVFEEKLYGSQSMRHYEVSGK